MPPEDRNALKVVLIDDALEFVSLVAESLDILGYESLVFNNPLDAVEAVRKGGVSLVITDYHMDGYTGLDIIRSVRNCDATIPVIVISGNPDETIESTTLANGACAFFRKPLDIEKLIMLAARICAALDRDGRAGRPAGTGEQ